MRCVMGRSHTCTYIRTYAKVCARASFQKILKENGKENGLKYSMIIRNDSRHSIKVRIVDVRIFFWENGFRWWLFARLVLRDPLYDSERFKESYYNYPLTVFKNKVEMSLFFTPKILRKCHYLHTTKIWSYV